MNRLLFLLFAAAEKTGQPGDKGAGDASSFGWQGLVVVGVLAALISLAYWFSRRWRQARAQKLLSSPAHLLVELCNRHGLGRPAQNLLAGLAREQGLQHPTLLFVDPRLWEASRLGALGTRYAAQLDGIREKIFDTAR
jgi:hypothetical protein